MDVTDLDTRKAIERNGVDHGFDDALSGWWHELFTSIPFGSTTPLRHFLACIDGEPVGTASAFVEDGVVGLASVGVREEYRRQGIGSAITLAALEAARNQSCRLGVLFSSPMATSMYEGLGFRQYGTGHCYLWSPEGINGKPSVTTETRKTTSTERNVHD